MSDLETNINQKSLSRAERLVIAGCLALALYCGTALVFEKDQSDSRSSKPIVAHAISPVDDVRFKSSTSFDWASLRDGLAIRQGDRVFTASGSSTSIAFLSGGRLDIGENSLVVFPDAADSIPTLKAGNFRITVQGQTKFRVGRETIELSGDGGSIQVIAQPDGRILARKLKGSVTTKSTYAFKSRPLTENLESVAGPHTIARVLATLAPKREATPVPTPPPLPTPEPTPMPPMVLTKPTPRPTRRVVRPQPRVVSVALKATTRLATPKEFVDRGDRGRVRLEWQRASQDQGDYTISITQPDGKERTFTTPETTFEYTPLAAKERVQVHVTRLLARAPANESEPQTIEIQEPGVLTPNSAAFPVDGHVLMILPEGAVALPLRQSPIQAATEYRYEVSKDAEFRSVLASRSTALPLVILRGTLSSGTYYFRSRYFTESGYSNWSVPVTFKVVRR